MDGPQMPTEPNTFDSLAHRRYAVILAGGSGTRLWPLSRATMPKQLLALNGKDRLLQLIAHRMAPMVDPARVLTVTHADHRFEVTGQLPAVSPKLAAGVLAEPVARNTLPAIAWAVARIARETPDALIGVFSSDHAVADAATFLQAWQAAEAAADAGYIALFRMQPTEPATGYGYIEAGAALSVPNAGKPVHRVARFVEKPSLQAAREFVAQGTYFWNGGMFVFRADRFVAALEKHQPALHAALAALAQCDAAAS